MTEDLQLTFEGKAVSHATLTIKGGDLGYDGSKLAHGDTVFAIIEAVVEDVDHPRKKGTIVRAHTAVIERAGVISRELAEDTFDAAEGTEPSLRLLTLEGERRMASRVILARRDTATWVPAGWDTATPAHDLIWAALQGLGELTSQVDTFAQEDYLRGVLESMAEIGAAAVGGIEWARDRLEATLLDQDAAAIRARMAALEASGGASDEDADRAERRGVTTDEVAQESPAAIADVYDAHAGYHAQDAKLDSAPSVPTEEEVAAEVPASVAPAEAAPSPAPPATSAPLSAGLPPLGPAIIPPAFVAVDLKGVEAEVLDGPDGAAWRGVSVLRLHAQDLLPEMMVAAKDARFHQVLELGGPGPMSGSIVVQFLPLADGTPTRAIVFGSHAVFVTPASVERARQFGHRPPTPEPEVASVAALPVPPDAIVHPTTSVSVNGVLVALDKATAVEVGKWLRNVDMANMVAPLIDAEAAGRNRSGVLQALRARLWEITEHGGRHIGTVLPGYPGDAIGMAAKVNELEDQADVAYVLAYEVEHGPNRIKVAKAAQTRLAILQREDEDLEAEVVAATAELRSEIAGPPSSTEDDPLAGLA
jgi:hypothetical protein